MILKEIYLYPDLIEFDKSVVGIFRDQSRSICNYIERHLKAIKFKSEGFKRICFVGKKKPSDLAYINSSKVLIVEVFFDEGTYNNLTDDELDLYFFNALSGGVDKVKEQFSIPSEAIYSRLNDFQKENYVNQWLFKKKNFKALGIQCSLNCELTKINFTLTLQIFTSDALVFEVEVLKTAPDEIVFTPLFKDVVCAEGRLLILDKFGDEVFSVDESSWK